jgi:hypothetical protein
MFKKLRVFLASCSVAWAVQCVWTLPAGWCAAETLCSCRPPSSCSATRRQVRTVCQGMLRAQSRDWPHGALSLCLRTWLTLETVQIPTRDPEAQDRQGWDDAWDKDASGDNWSDGSDWNDSEARPKGGRGQGAAGAKQPTRCACPLVFDGPNESALPARCAYHAPPPPHQPRAARLLLFG